MDELTVNWLEFENKEEVFNEIMTTYGTELLQLVYSYVKDQTVAEELTQDIFVKVYYSLHTYKKKSKFKTWLWRIAINHCKDHLKSWYNNHVIKVEEIHLEEDRKENVEMEVLQKEENQNIVSAVMDLPILYREIIFLYYFKELTMKEISSVLKVNENTIKTRLRRAKELLKQKIGD
ncbi:sigma-70 family RNA polymerase sigma factor [Bacillus sp. B1-b2]|uniref:sigma-70 family RNA polymerase sigma factor n=1 Tax=Bacillus sp. B1-b2 TaxID=2653201 RepID=UPI001261BCC2|nr:sigma-70 family RNA polymerase sigma factor [Bacillus sp. B1-b2]KAB7666277.1 sigma-70 family RNA polymerase sigma factor [Bacillus sp. B1-b2]